MTQLLAAIGYTSWVLPALLIIPLVGAGVLLALAAGGKGDQPGPARTARMIAFLTLLAEFIVSVGLWWSFENGAGWHASVDVPWIPTWGVRFSIGLDGFGLMMVLLTTFLMPLTVLGGWTSVRTKVHSYLILLLVMTTGMLGVFLARDLFLFYVMWEVMLMPMYFIIGIWGGERRIYAS
ncbi:MAG: hypothetical protein WD553_03895, partial [Gemmatimonadaceae bacterium]